MSRDKQLIKSAGELAVKIVGLFEGHEFGAVLMALRSVAKPLESEFPNEAAIAYELADNITAEIDLTDFVRSMRGAQ